MMVMRSFPMNLQVHTLKVIYHVIAIIGVIRLSAGSWWWASIAGYILLNRVGSDIGFHRYFTHESFKTNKVFGYLLLFLGTLDCKGSLFSWMASHSAHHASADREGDPHSPQRIGMAKVWLFGWEEIEVPRRQLAKYINRKVFRFTHNHYFLLVIGFMFALALIDIRLLVFGYCVPLVYSLHVTGLINSIGHRFGYRNFDTPDDSRNNLFVHFISLGGCLHNNHHGRPSSYRQSTERWFEWDPAAWMIEIVRRRD
jgi:stearoyl-CoA desaturase (delta-9 desaturase)